MPRAFVPVSRDPVSLVSAVSGVGRVWEDYGVDGFTLLYSSTAPQESVDIVEEWAVGLVGREGVSRRRVSTSPEELEGAGYDILTRKLREVFEDACEEGGVVLVSSAGRRLAASMAVTGVWLRDCSLDVVHLYFYFGPWSGLPYPYTPRRLEPLIILHPSRGPYQRGEERNAAKRAPDLSGHCESPYTGRLPPLRCAMAELARRINAASRGSYLLPSMEKPECGKLVVRVNNYGLAAGDLCREQEMARVASRLAQRIMALEEDLGYPIRSALAWTGLAHLRARLPSGEVVPLPRLFRERSVIVDSVMVYYGVHRYYWEGGHVLVPECAIREIHGRMAESVKRGRLGRGDQVADALAYLGLEDLLSSGAPVLPTPAGECDTAIPKVDPVLLDGKLVATADDGAYRYWSRHPARKLAEPIKVFFEPEESVRQEVDPLGDPQSISRLYYSLYQALLVLALLDSQGFLELELTVQGEGWEERVQPPVRVLEKELGLASRRRG